MEEHQKTDEKTESTATQTPELPPPGAGEELADLEKFLGEIGGSGWKLALYRRSPAWCRGYVESFDLDSPISMAEIRDAYGGSRYEARILDDRGMHRKTRYLTIADVPRMRGEPLDQGLKYRRGGNEVIENPRADQAAATADRALEALERAQERNQELMIELLATRSIPQQQSDPIAQMGQMIGLFKTFQEFSATAAPSAGGLDYVTLIKTFAEEILPKLNKQPTPQTIRPPVSHREAAPLALPRTAQPQQNPSAAPNAESSAAPTLGEPTANDEEELLPSIAEELAEAGPEGAAEMIAETLGMWNEEQRDRAIRHLMFLQAAPAPPQPNRAPEPQRQPPQAAPDKADNEIKVTAE